MVSDQISIKLQLLAAKRVGTVIYGKKNIRAYRII